MTEQFTPINKGHDSVYQSGKLSLGLVVPLERYGNTAVPDMRYHAERVKIAESLGFSAVWLRDVPFNVPSFGDAGQVFDPFVYLGYLAAQTTDIALGVASIVLPLRHPAHVAKAAASADVLSGGRVILGVASGDRPDEYPALNQSFDDRGARFRHAVDYIIQSWKDKAAFHNPYGSPYGDMDLLPKPQNGHLPLLITGASQQAPDWLAENGDGWITYPRDIQSQDRIITDWRTRTRAAGLSPKPATQSLYIDLVADADAPPSAIHLGFRSGVNYLREYLKSLENIGMNHVALNLRFNKDDIEPTLQRLADGILPDFNNRQELT